MHSSSRRSFLAAGRPVSGPWGQFCRRVRRMVKGELFEYRVEGGLGGARLTLEDAAGIHHVRALCEQYGVVLALDGLAMPVRSQGLPVVWVRPGRGLARLEALDSSKKKWFAQPGCTMAELVAAGFQGFEALAPQLTVAAWLADRTLVDYAPGACAASGLEHLRLLLGDGEEVTLGPFGRDNTRALEGLRLQQLVPALFRLSAQEGLHAWLKSGFWPGRYRLDALMPDPGGAINLAHLCLGHGGDLGWVQWVVLDAGRAGLAQDASAASPFYGQDAVEGAGWGEQAMLLDHDMKSLFDPPHVFSDPGQQL